MELNQEQIRLVMWAIAYVKESWFNSDEYCQLIQIARALNDAKKVTIE